MTTTRPITRRTFDMTGATLAALVALGAFAPLGHAVAADTIKGLFGGGSPPPPRKP